MMSLYKKLRGYWPQWTPMPLRWIAPVKQLSLCIGLCLFICPNLWASSLKTDPEIQQLLQSGAQQSDQHIAQRAQFFSAALLKKPYLLGALGEGPHATVDTDPLYRLDSFDCLTYVSTVLALAHARTSHEFKAHLKQLRYRGQSIGFSHRNHFTSLDWNPHNQKKRYIKDITATVSSHVHYAYATINKPAWYAKLDPNEINTTRKLSAKQQHAIKQHLQRIAKHSQQQPAHISYIPLHKLFNRQNKLRPMLIQLLPEISLIELVRPHWDLTKEIGTSLLVAHVGFVIKRQDKLYLRHASSRAGQVVEVPLQAYLQPFRFATYAYGVHFETLRSH